MRLVNEGSETGSKKVQRFQTKRKTEREQLQVIEYKDGVQLWPVLTQAPGRGPVQLTSVLLVELQKPQFAVEDKHSTLDHGRRIFLPRFSFSHPEFFPLPVQAGNLSASSGDPLPKENYLFIGKSHCRIPVSWFFMNWFSPTAR